MSSYLVCIIRICVKKRQVLQNYPARPAENEDRGRSPLQSTSRQRTKTSHMIQTANTQRTASKQSSTCAISLSRMLTGSVSAQESMRKTDLDPLMRGQYLSRSRLQTNLINSFVEAIGQSRQGRQCEMVHTAIIVCDFSLPTPGKN